MYHLLLVHLPLIIPLPLIMINSDSQICVALCCFIKQPQLVDNDAFACGKPSKCKKLQRNIPVLQNFAGLFFLEKLLAELFSCINRIVFAPLMF